MRARNRLLSTNVKNLVTGLETSNSLGGEFKSDQEELGSIVEAWNKLKKSPAKRKASTSGCYQKAQETPIMLSLTIEQKSAKKCRMNLDCNSASANDTKEERKLYGSMPS